jgi:2-oxoglutarate ferredoxin oxidoreductase subunit alpha
MLAFDKADEYRNPVMIFGDGVIGQVMEPFYPTPYVRPELPKKDWILDGCKNREPRVIKSLYMGEGELERKNNLLLRKYKKMKDKEVRYESYFVEDSDIIVVAFGIAARIAFSAIRNLRREGIEVGLFRPITLFPFPERELSMLAEENRQFITIEMNAGQMVEDVRLAINGKSKVFLYGRPGGAVFTPEELYEKIKIVATGKEERVESLFLGPYR